MPVRLLRRISSRVVDGIDVAVLTRTLCELGQVEHLGDLGRNGPLLASAGGASLFHCLFGRDAIRMAMDLLDDFPLVARVTITELAHLQGVRDHPRAEEEPGRILHEHREPDDPRARLLEWECGWAFPFFGAVDTTPQWINLLAAYAARHGPGLLDQEIVDRAGCRTSVRGSLLGALGWLVRRLDDPTGGGFVWVRRTHAGSLANQSWEDSSDSHYYADGTLFDPARPYAPVAVQGYVYDALLAAADLVEAAPEACSIEPGVLRARASGLRARVLARFWQPDLGTFANAVTVEPDGALRPAREVASSAGHLLANQLLDGPDVAETRARLIARLAEPDLVATAGIRTRSTRAARFRPGSYHNGSVWPMDTGVIADGLRRHGCDGQAADLEQRILDACAWAGGFPEFFRGDPEGQLAVNHEIIDAVVDGVPNRLEQLPHTKQGWTATRVWRILGQRGAPVLPARSASAPRPLRDPLLQFPTAARASEHAA